MVASITVKDNSIQVKKELLKVSQRVPRAIKKALANAAAFEIGAIKKRKNKKKKKKRKPSKRKVKSFNSKNYKRTKRKFKRTNHNSK